MATITLQQGVISLLTENGMATEQAYLIVGMLSAKRVINWSSTDYAPSDLAQLRQSAQQVGLEWIKQNVPEAWFRPMFESG